MNTTQEVVHNAPKVSQKNGIPQGNLPEKKFRAGAISATVWLNKGHRANGEESEYRTVSVERSYMDKEGKWQSTTSFRVGDLPKAVMALQKAYEHAVFNEQDLFKGGY